MLKKVIACILGILLLLNLAACGGGENKPAETETSYLAKAEDVAYLDEAYRGREAYHGEMHDHADTGGTSDGQKDLAFWKLAMDGFDMEFATIVDHQQALHMQLEDWDDTFLLVALRRLRCPATWQQPPRQKCTLI